MATHLTLLIFVLREVFDFEAAKTDAIKESLDLVEVGVRVAIDTFLL